jgi:hypothetical protein
MGRVRPSAWQRLALGTGSICTTSTGSTGARLTRRPSAFWPSSSPRGWFSTSACRKPELRRSARRAPGRRIADRVLPVGPVTLRRSCCRSCASSGSASCPTRLSATASSPARFALRTTSRTTTGARPTLGSPARTSRATCASSTRFKPLPPRPKPPPGLAARPRQRHRALAPAGSPASSRTRRQIVALLRPAA